MKIFFDVDGVLMNNIHMKRGWLNRWDKDIEKDLGIAPEKFQEIFHDWFLKVQIGQLDFEESMDRWLKFHGYNAAASHVIEYWNQKDMNLNEDLWPAIRSLSQNANIELYVATNQSHARANHLWQNGFKDHFKKIYYSAALSCFKQDGNYFRQIEEELGFDPRKETVLFFDDDERNVKVSSERGWNAVCFDTHADVVNHPLIQPLLVS
ncbi:MAG: hypothetical protein DI551_03620 [Micavibrio aeruginosavorus]|uniref:Haloacid dehalogenase n=1 Tax=Micavibrio aeruginosavorus TaxID=349221 RepID=A0A2W5N3L7_9BACT|nr:MAG: hypothetical protein DI551_03620 [Micavibrio aeruginosavorus]